MFGRLREWWRQDRLYGKSVDLLAAALTHPDGDGLRAGTNDMVISFDELELDSGDYVVRGDFEIRVSRTR